MSIYTIKMDFRKAMEKARDLDNVSNNLKKLANQQYSGSLNRLSREWTGENSESFIKKGDALREQMTGTAEDIHRAAEVIREIAREIYEAEMEAWRIAHERK